MGFFAKRETIDYIVFELMHCRFVVELGVAGKADLYWRIVVQVSVTDDVLAELLVVPFALAELDDRSIEPPDPVGTGPILFAHLAARFVPGAGQQDVDVPGLPGITLVR